VSNWVRLLIITGSMGAGKTTVMSEASDLLARRGLVHAALDFDGLAIGHFPAHTHVNPRQLAIANLDSIWRNALDAAATALLLAAAVESRTELGQLRSVLRPHDLVVCRLRAPVATMQDRLRVREPGILQSDFLRRASDLEAVLDKASIEDFSLTNEHRSVTDVAHEMLVRAGWLDEDLR
jgi:hypothetical protein